MATSLRSKRNHFLSLAAGAAAAAIIWSIFRGLQDALLVFVVVMVFNLFVMLVMHWVENAKR